MRKKFSDKFFILSPIIVLFITQVTALVLGKILSTSVYIPIILIYWIVIGFFEYSYGFENIKRWLKKPQGHWIWVVIALVLGVSSLPLFLQNISIFKNISVLIPSVIFLLVNPWLEEFYWRGLLLDITEKWPHWLSVLYSSVLFTLWHSAFAWYSVAARGMVFFLTVLILGVFMALIYKKTKSLWLCILSHMLINLFNMGIPTIMNLITFE